MARRLQHFVTATAVLLALAAGSASAKVYHACLQASSGGHTWYYDLRSDTADQAAGTTLDRWLVNGAVTYVDRQRYGAFHEPAAGTTTWDEGVAFAATMQTRHAWLNTEQTKAAVWVADPASGDVTWIFRTTVNGGAQDYTFTTGQCKDLTPGNPPATDAPATDAPATDAPTEPQQPDTEAPPSGGQCVSAGGYFSVECDGTEDCCGAGTMRPHCVSQSNGDKCCRHYLDSTTCTSTQSCCGSSGPGASSYASCCDAGTECCQARISYDGSSTCCPAGTKCCSASTIGLCCAMNEECDPDFNRCKPAASGPPATDAPNEPQQPDTEPQQPDTEPPAASLHVCLQASSGGFTYYYEITSNPANDAHGTTFDRYRVNGAVDSLVDSNTFAALRMPPEDAPWHQGIQFADSMQSRGVWINVEPTTAAWISDDTLTFQTTVNGRAQLYIFRASQCR
jgi:hypothetical protein